MGDKPCSMCLQLKGASFKVALTRWTTLTTWFWGADTKTSTTDIVWRNGFGSKLYFSWAGNILKWSHIYVQVARFPHEKTKVKMSDSAGFTYFTSDPETFQRCTLTLSLQLSAHLGIAEVMEVHFANIYRMIIQLLTPSTITWWLVLSIQAAPGAGIHSFDKGINLLLRQ